jgi:hypothetical protein
LHVLFFILRDFAAKGLSRALDVFCIDLDAGEFSKQLAALLETDHRTNRGDPAGDSRRQGGVVQTQLPVARAEAVAAGHAVKIGALQFKWPEHTLQRFFAPSGVTGQLPARTTSVTGIVIGVIGIEALLYRSAGQMERLPADRRFQGLQVEVLQSLSAQQRLDVPQNFSGEQSVERGFF